MSITRTHDVLCILILLESQRKGNTIRKRYGKGSCVSFVYGSFDGTNFRKVEFCVRHVRNDKWPWEMKTGSLPNMLN